ncbi:MULTISPECIES: TRAP transporter permease [Halomonadaceae]|jgi:TRAP transporter 4TM/12TM fusion protein|uniref:C4-dicarboxylate ABC transporter n=1 Tax=Vreelandella aquamarina TaxID=77097 RepID=A0A857GRF1_9GAMM|nr:MULTISPECIES: TRAP transporter fused permease subunit [Halomonas]QHD51196.1 C4-dicarboxylate ABC transporter [Halomonas meridiana]QPL45907.1 TRAP transporter fused permease subunit [Halomonas sp. A40-4]|tara:strand:+ start:2762 stop:4675 length:1914 start_codon:yes stop_codon:yes gene_type:complete
MNQILSVFTGTGAKRQLTGKLGMAVHGCAALVALAVIYTTTIVYVDLYVMMVVFLSAMLALLFINISPGPLGRKDRPGLIDWCLVLASIAVGVYFLLESQRIAERITLLFPLETPDLLAASVLLALTIEATRRTVGFGLTSVVMVFVVYNLWGHGLPGALGFREVSYNHFLDIMMFTSDGLFGVPLRVAATYAFLFVMFGTFLSKAGGAEFFYNLSSALAGRRTGGPAKIAVISSGLYGTMSGSPTSDVVTTGSVTIPIMQRLGYSKPLSGSVEVAASTGGSLLPPVMGSAAFIMAEYTGIEYREIAIAGIVPALLYYLCVYAQVHLRSQKLGLRGLSKEETPPLKGTLKNGGLFIVPLVALSGALLMGYSPTFVAAIATAVVLMVAMVHPSTRMGPRAIWNALAVTTLRMVSVVAACAAAGLVIGGISMTGLGGKFADLVYLMAGDSAFLALVISAVLAIILGMGMPTPSAFILGAVLVGPTLLSMDFSVLQTNMFILYFAVLSAMTPPVAVAAFAASAIADASPLKIAVGAVRLAITAFIVPFAFVYGEGLLMVGSWQAIAVSCVTAILGVLLLSIAVEGYWRQPLAILQRLGFGLAGLLFITPSWWAVVAAVLVGVVAIIASPHLRLHGHKTPV